MNFVRKLAPFVVFGCIVAAGGVIFLQRNNILDYLALRGYEPPAQIKALASNTTMTPYGERLFFVNRPVLSAKDVFNQQCTDTTDHVATLGCYTGDRRGIYLYDVTDARLNGVEEVTAAHEMLHQAYDRLSVREKERINSLLQAHYEQLADPGILEQMDTYKKTEPDQLLNEMHSIFGTQIRELPTELAAYYEQYFTNRLTIVGYYEQYRAEFDQRRKQIQIYDAELDNIKSQIESHKTNLKSREAQLSIERAKLDAHMAQNDIAAYNAGVPGFNSLVNAYRAEVNKTNQIINEFNRILDARNAIAIQEQELQQALDSQVEQAQ